MAQDFQNSPHFMQGSVRTYGTATRKLTEVWKRTYGEDLSLRETQPKARYEEAVARFAAQIDRQRGPELMDTLRQEEETAPEVDGLTEEIKDLKNFRDDAATHRDIDDVPPNLCMQMIRDVIQNLAIKEEENIIDLRLWDVLRQAMRDLAPNMGWPSPARVGANSNFPRLWQYVCEICEASSGPFGAGIRVINTRGSVPEYPISPGNLRLRVDRELL